VYSNSIQVIDNQYITSQKYFCCYRRICISNVKCFDPLLGHSQKVRVN